MRTRILLCAALLSAAAPVEAQLASEFGVTVAPSYRTFGFDESLGITSASLLLAPVAVTVPLGSRFSLDAYGAWADGSAEVDGETLKLSGPVDTQVRGVWAAAPWARVTLGVNVPTGNAAHDPEEAVVASVLSTDLLGFREANFGVGLGVTTGLAVAHQLGEWGVGYGASYRMTGEYEPSSESDATYSPGDEIVARLAIDRNVGAGGKLTFGGTYQYFSNDEFGENNLFEPGPRVRGDATWSFRAGPNGTVSLFVTDLFRAEGQRSVGPAVGAQNVLIFGAGADLGGRLRFTPRADMRILSTEEGVGSGWLGSVGTGVEFRLGGIAAGPRAAFMIGSIENVQEEGAGITGFEVGLTARF